LPLFPTAYSEVDEARQAAGVGYDDLRAFGGEAFDRPVSRCTGSGMNGFSGVQ
jgi:hypothetical protein